MLKFLQEKQYGAKTPIAVGRRKKMGGTPKNESLPGTFKNYILALKQQAFI